MRNLVGKWYRDGKVFKTISYQRINNVLPKLVSHVVQKGLPGDFFTVHHRHTGLEIGSIEVSEGGLKSEWVWDKIPKAA